MYMDDILKKYNLSLILMHGSQVDGKIHPKSDIDIAVLPKNIHNKIDTLKLYGDFIDYFKNDTIDIVNLTQASPLLAFVIAKKSKLLAGSESSYEKFQFRAFHKYCDYLPYLRMEADFVKERMKLYATN